MLNNVLHQVFKEHLSIVNHVSSDNYNFSCLEIAHGTNPGVLSALSILPWYPDVWHLTEAVASTVVLNILDRSIIFVQIIFTAIFIFNVLQRVYTCTANAHKDMVKSSWRTFLVFYAVSNNIHVFMT